MEIISKKFSVLTFIPALAKEIGLENAIIIQQITYWITKTQHIINQKPWIYNTFEQWHQQFPFFSISTIKRIFYRLEKMGLITSKKMNVHKSDHTKWYTLNFDMLESILPNSAYSKTLKSSSEKKFDLSHHELSLCQNDTINIGKTKNNSQKNNYLSKDKENLANQKSITKQKIERQKENFSEKEMEICNQMIQVWNEVLIKSENKLCFSERRGRKMLSLWSNLMEEKIEKWQDFCLKINSSKFLMGEKDGSKFKAYNDWLLQEETANKILVGEYGVGDRVPEVKREEKARQTLLIREKLIENQIAKNREYERQEQINNISNALREQAIKELESQWNENEKQKVHEEFSTYLLDKFGWVFSEYKLKGIDSPLVSLHYDFYLIEKYFNNDPNIFINKAKEMIEIVISN